MKYVNQLNVSIHADRWSFIKHINIFVIYE